MKPSRLLGLPCEICVSACYNLNTSQTPSRIMLFHIDVVGFATVSIEVARWQRIA